MLRPLLLVLAFVSFGASAQSSQYFNCNLSVMRAASAEDKRCDSESTTRYEQSVCKARVAHFIARNACSIALIDMGRAVGFLYDRMADIDSPQFAKKMSLTERNAQYAELSRMVAAQHRESQVSLDVEMNRIEAERSAARANAAITSSIYLIGGSNLNRVDNNTFTYIYQGKPTTCTTVGNVISCL